MLRRGALRRERQGRPRPALGLRESTLTEGERREAEVREGLRFAVCGRLRGRLEKLARRADEAVEIDGGLADAYYQRAVVALARQNGLQALDDLVVAIGLDARHLQARKALAMLRHAQGDDAEARRLLAEVLAIDPVSYTHLTLPTNREG